MWNMKCLILQFHYVGFDKIPMPVKKIEMYLKASQLHTQYDPLRDAVIAEGDEHIVEVTGGPMASMISLEALLVKQFP